MQRHLLACLAALVRHWVAYVSSDAATPGDRLDLVGANAETVGSAVAHCCRRLSTVLAALVQGVFMSDVALQLCGFVAAAAGAPAPVHHHAAASSRGYLGPVTADPLLPRDHHGG